MIYTDKFGITTGGTYDPTIIITGITNTINGSSTDYEIPTAKAVFDNSVSGDTSTLESTLVNGNTADGLEINLTDGTEYDTVYSYQYLNIDGTAGDGWRILVSPEEGILYYHNDGTLQTINYNYISNYDGTYTQYLYFDTSLTDNRSIYLPDNDGTIALLDDVAVTGLTDISKIYNPDNGLDYLGIVPNFISDDFSLFLNEYDYDTAFHFVNGNLTSDLSTGSDSQINNMVLVGDDNRIRSGSTYSIILGGYKNSIGGYLTPVYGLDNSAIVGGQQNDVKSNNSGTFCSYNGEISADYAAILGGTNNTVTHTGSVIIGSTKTMASQANDTVYVDRFEVVNQSTNQIIMYDVVDEARYYVTLSGGTFVMTAV